MLLSIPIAMPFVGNSVYHEGSPYLFVAFLGLLLSISALPVLARILKEYNLLQSKFGMLIMMISSLDDIVGWPFTALLEALSTGGGDLKFLLYVAHN